MPSLTTVGFCGSPSSLVFADCVRDKIALLAHEYMWWEEETSWLDPASREQCHDWWRESDALVGDKEVLHKEDLYRMMDALDERDWSLHQGCGGYRDMDYLLGQFLRKLASRMGD